MFQSLESRRLFSVVTVAPISVTEPTVGSADAIFTATLKSASSSDVVVTYATANKTARAGSDYAASNGSVTIPAGSTSATFGVPVLADGISEANETFAVHLKVSARNGVNRGAVATIADSDPPPTVTVVDTAAAEPANHRRATATVLVALSNPSSRAVTVRLRTVDGSAIAGTDYVPAFQSVVIRPGQTTASVKFTVLGDPAVTDERKFIVVLTKAVLATPDPVGLDGTVTLLRTGDGAQPVVTVASATVAAGGTEGFAVTLSGPSTDEVAFNYATVAGTAAIGDYTVARGTIIIPAGETAATLTVATMADPSLQGEEQFTLALSNPINATLAAATATATITPAVDLRALSVAPTSVTEGNTGTTPLLFTVTLSSPQGSAVTVDYATSDGTAMAGSDYVAATGTLTFAPGQTSGTIAVTVDGDTTVEPDETLVLTLSSPTNAVLGTAIATGTILNDDAALPTLSVGGAAVTADGSAATTLSFPVTLSAAATTDVTVAYATADGTATVGADYVAASGTLTIAAGSTTGTVAVTVNPQTAAAQVTRYLSVTLSSPTNAALGTATATGAITIPTPAPTVSVTNAVVTASSSATTTLSFAVTLSAASTSAVRVLYATSDGTALAGTDYEAVSGTLTFVAGNTTGVINVVVDPATAAAATTKTLRLTLSSPEDATLASPVATGTINVPTAAGTSADAWDERRVMRKRFTDRDVR